MRHPYFRLFCLAPAALFAPLLFLAVPAASASTILAIQDFELTPAGPVWGYSGTPNDFQSGFSGSGATPASSPLGIGGSRAWHVVSVSGGNPLTFDNILLPTGYSSFEATFRLAAMNLNGSTGGPDDLDYVLVEYSLDGGTIWTPRVRIRGAVANNSSWAYDATGVASVDYLPATEALFQPTTSGLQTTFGFSTVEIFFPGSLNQLSLRITPRSSSSSDSWLIDNVALVGVAAVPEPSTWLLLSAGGGLLAFLRRKALTESRPHR